MLWANEWFNGSPEMLIFWATFAPLSEVLLFWPFCDFDTLISEESVLFIIFGTWMFIFDITHHISFVHNFPPFTIHVRYIILSNCLWFHGSMKIHNIIQTNYYFFTPQPFGLEGYCRHGSGGRAGGRAGGCQTCRTHISVTAWRIFSIRSSMELSGPVVVHCHGNLPICPIWACPWAKNLSNLPQIGSRLCGTHISETAGWIYPI